MILSVAVQARRQVPARARVRAASPQVLPSDDVKSGLAAISLTRP